MMINREHPDSVRITPSKGDGGIDILDRGGDNGNGDVVYQVKGFSGPLNSRQKMQIVDSLERALDPVKGDPRWKRLQVTKWVLVMPWGPTPEADAWLQEITAQYGVKAVWAGLTFVDQLAAKYPDVTDYYLEGGNHRILEAQKEVISLMSTTSLPESELAAPEVARRLKDALRALDHDPHYRYEFSMGYGEPPTPPMRPRLVMSEVRFFEATSSWYIISVIARCAASVTERPITTRLTLQAAVGSKYGKELRDFVDFGIPFTTPEGVVNGETDAPAGLGGPIENATLSVFSLETRDKDISNEFRLEVLDPDGNVIALADIDRTRLSSGKAGAHAVFEETHGVFVLSLTVDQREQNNRLELKVNEIEGRPVSVVLPAVRVLNAFQSPNSFQLSNRNIPSRPGNEIPIGQTTATSLSAELDTIVVYLDLLNTIQQYAAEVVKVPNFVRHAEIQRDKWLIAATVLSGESLMEQRREGSKLKLCITREAGEEIATGSFDVSVPLDISIGEQQLSLGQMIVQLVDAELIESTERDDGVTISQYKVPGNVIRYMPDRNTEESQ